MSDVEVSYERRGRLGVIRLERPDALNALTLGMIGEVERLSRAAERDPEVTAICITGAGRGFCAGIDMSVLTDHASNGPPPRAEARDGRPRRPALFSFLLDISKPVIAAINGAAAGVGLVLAAFADLRFAAAGAKFTTAHGRFNFPAEFGLSWVLPRIIGLTHASDVLLSSRVFTAEEAMAMGFLNKVLPAEALIGHVMSYARDMADQVAPGSARATKHQIYRDLHRGAADAVTDAERLLEEMIRHPDYGEGIKAWMQKRRAQWVG